MIVLRLKGGLGNQMFQYALGRVLAIKNNTELIFNIEAYEDKNKRPFKNNFSIRTFALDIFNIKGRIAKKKEIPFLYRMYFKGKLMLLIDAVRRRIFRHKAQELYFQKFNPSFLELKDNAYLDGFFHSPKYFEGYKEIIREDFTPRQDFDERIKILTEEIRENNSLCIHVRRGDYVGNKYHEIVGKDYYDNGIEKIKRLAKIDKIYVFSDDIKWCKDNMKFEFPVMFVGEEYAGKKAEGHLFLMSCCRNFIIPNSSFSWWGAWLSQRTGKIIICPKQWFGDININTDDLIPKEWIRI